MNQMPNICIEGKGRGHDCGACVAQRISICAHLSGPGMAKLRAMATRTAFAKGAILFEQDRPLESVFVLLSGTVKMYRLLADGQRQITGFLGPGDLLGGIKGQSTTHCTAQAVTEVVSCAFDRAAFLRFLVDHPELCFRLLIMATDEIEAQHGHATLLGRRRVDQRLAAFLLQLSHRWPDGEEPQSTVWLPMSRADIADHLGQTIESLSRAFSHLRGLGYIDTPKPSLVHLRNLPALYDLAGFDELPAQHVSLGL